MAPSNEPCFVSAVMLDVIDEVDWYLGVAWRYGSTGPLVDEGLVLKQLLDLSLLSLLEQRVPNIVVNADRFSMVPRS